MKPAIQSFMFSSYLFVLLSSLIFVSGIVFLVVSVFQKNRYPSDASGPDDGDDQGGGLDWDLDAPLDLPPGVYTLPPEPVRV